jgi:transposase
LYQWRKEYEEFGQGSFSSKVDLKQMPEQEQLVEEN